MQEDFLHFCWKFRKFASPHLTTTDGETVTIIHPGQHNHDAGPDFAQARVKIGDLIWAGDLEIHTYSRFWHQHEHHKDPAYNNVILHVVYRDDKPVYKENGQRMPTVELAPHIDLELVQRYEALIAHKSWVPCAAQLKSVDAVVWTTWLERLAIERMEQRVQELETVLQWTNNNWEEAFYIRLMRYMGMKVNATPFEQVAKSLPLKLLAKHKNQLLPLEAMLFGQAGLLAQIFTDAYPVELQKEYDFLRKKYALQPIPASAWKWMRLRPANFPTIRLAQMAQLIFQSQHLFSRVLEAEDVTTLSRFFDVTPSTYWRNHYQFDKQSRTRVKKLGKTAINNLLINTVIPFVFFYGRYKSQPNLQEKALNWLAALPPEKNSITSKWAALVRPAAHAGESQAMLQLKKNYCDPVRCLQCAVGNKILQQSS